jgi:hypothetical protein
VKRSQDNTITIIAIIIAIIVTNPRHRCPLRLMMVAVVGGVSIPDRPPFESDQTLVSFWDCSRAAEFAAGQGQNHRDGLHACTSNRWNHQFGSVGYLAPKFAIYFPLCDTHASLWNKDWIHIFPIFFFATTLDKKKQYIDTISSCMSFTDNLYIAIGLRDGLGHAGPPQH